MSDSDCGCRDHAIEDLGWRISHTRENGDLFSCAADRAKEIERFLAYGHDDGHKFYEEALKSMREEILARARAMAETELARVRLCVEVEAKILDRMARGLPFSTRS